MTHLIGGVWLMYQLYGATPSRRQRSYFNRRFIVAIHDHSVMGHHLRRRGRGLERAERDHVQVALKALEFGGFRVGSVRSSVRREVGGDLT